MEWILLYFKSIRQDLQDLSGYFFVFNNFQKKLLKANPPSVERRSIDLQLFYSFIHKV